MTYAQAEAQAKKTSLEESCVQHVEAIVEGENATVMGYRVSDWCDSATVASFENGNRLG